MNLSMYFSGSATVSDFSDPIFRTRLIVVSWGVLASSKLGMLVVGIGWNMRPI